MIRIPIRFGLAIASVVFMAGCSASAATTSPAATQAATPAATPVPSAAQAPTPITTPAPSPVQETTVPGFVLTSPSFTEGGEIPVKFTCDGDNLSPALHWVGAPAGTQSLALIVNDLDAGSFVHWIAYNIAGSASGDLAEGITEAGPPAQAMTSFGANKYGGPCPPSGTHRYQFTLYALSWQLTIEHPSTASEAAVKGAMDGLILARTKLTANYTKPS